MTTRAQERNHMTRAQDKRRQLREGLADGPVVTIGAHDAMSAQLTEQAGFDAVWVSGFGVSTMTYALPDLNLVTMTEALDAARRIDSATSLPVVADCDNGFGGFGNVVRTVREYEQAGIAGICIEDNLFPKRNSLLQQEVKRPLIDAGEQARRIRAGKEEKDDQDFVIIARVEALIAGHGVDEACRRADSYAEAGADAILMHSKDKTLGEIDQFLDQWQGLGSIPLVAVPSLFPSFTTDELRDKGFNMVIFANHPMRAAIKAMEDVLELMAKHRKVDILDDMISPLEHVFGLVKTQETIEREAVAFSDAE
jgi:phosphoenolpyruvate phosphomutase